jgi:hypothetical protein
MPLSESREVKNNKGARVLSVNLYSRRSGREVHACVFGD